MKWIIISIIKFYQKFLSSFTPDCIYNPSCSEYCILAVKKYGFLKGMIKTKKRINKCDMEHIHLYGSDDFP
jgi:uncharacterized protein